MVLLESQKTLLGSPAQDFSLSGIDGNVYSLKSFTEAKALVVIFMCNHCPYVQAVLSRLNTFSDEFSKKGVQFIGINANDAENYPEDSFESMKNLPIRFPYLYDESQEVAKIYGAVCTPDIFVYDSQRKLAYHGRIDDNSKDEALVTKKELADALEKILRGEHIPPEDQKSSRGCSIKWKERVSH
ncbi:thioredoxin family protein [Candidatus Peregrinibacteria bacterium]|nr:thioredoxin family protein [Candidatus Peregrinibacteria bacterium]